MAKKKRMRITGGYITHLSLCTAGANNLQTIYKSQDLDQGFEVSMASKAMNEEGIIVAAVYVPELEDLQGDVASAEAIKMMAYSFAKNGEGIDIMHNEKVMPKDAVYVAESFIIQKNDPRFEGMRDYDGYPVATEGGWGVVIKVDDPDLKERYRNQEWNGVSMGGLTTKRQDTEDSIRKSKGHRTNLDRIVKLSSNGKDVDMTKEEMMALLAESNKSLVAALAPAIAESIAKAMNPEKKTQKSEEQQAAEEAVAKSKKAWMAQFPDPVLPANPTEEQIAKAEKAVEIIELAKAVDPTNLQEKMEFYRARKSIMDGSYETPRQQADVWGIFNSNQTVSEAKKAGDVGDDANPISWDAKSTDELTDAEVTNMLKLVPAKDVDVKTA